MNRIVLLVVPTVALSVTAAWFYGRASSERVSPDVDRMQSTAEPAPTAVTLPPVPDRSERGEPIALANTTNSMEEAEAVGLPGDEWMLIRNAKYEVTAEMRLSCLTQSYRKLKAMEGDSYSMRSQMLNVASYVVATNLDFRGQATQTANEPNDRQWKFGSDGAFYVFDKGQFDVYDGARRAHRAAQKRMLELTDGGSNPGAARDPQVIIVGLDPIDPALLQDLDRMVAETIDLLTKE